MPNPYDVLFRTPELVPFYTALLLFLVAWVYLSFRKLFKWYISIREGINRSRGDPLLPDDITGDIFWFLTTIGANLVLIGAYLYVVV